MKGQGCALQMHIPALPLINIDVTLEGDVAFLNPSPKLKSLFELFYLEIVKET